MQNHSKTTSLLSRLGAKLGAILDSTLAKKNGRLYLLVGLGGALVLVTLGMLSLLGRIQQGVSVSGNTATITFTPGTSNVTPATSQSIALKSNIGTASVDGFQVFADFSGTLPSDLSFTGSNLSGSGLTLITGDIIDNTSGGKTLRLLFITADPTKPFSATGDVELGRVFFTVPSSGHLTITPNTTLTKIIDHSDSSNIVTAPAAVTYTYAAPASSSSSSSSISTSSSVSSTTSTTTTSSSTSSATSSTGTCSQYTATYFNNQTLSGTPVLTRCESAINYDWGGGSPNSAVNAEGFSARWTAAITIPSTGAYRFSAISDDGVRVYVDGVLAIDKWFDQSATATYTADQNLTAGSHQIKVEYYENTGNAKINVSIAQVTASSSSSTSTAVSSSSSSSSVIAGLTCGLIDVDNNKILDIVDFADFAKKYNQSCTQVDLPTTTNPVTYDYQTGSTADVDVKLTNVGTSNAVDIDLSVTNAQVLGFTPSTTNGWLGSIGFCNAQQALFTTNRVCTAMTKDANILEGEVAGKVKLQFSTAGTVTVARTSTFAYSNGQTKVSAPGTMYTFSVGTNTGATTTPNPCGRQDVNADNRIDLIDFSSLGRKYNQANCGVN